VLFKVLFVFVVLAHERRRVVHINVTDTPTAQWTAQQLVEAFPWETAPRYLLRCKFSVNLRHLFFSGMRQPLGHRLREGPSHSRREGGCLQPWCGARSSS
jgi:hypothetical protein